MAEWRPVPGWEGYYEVSDDGRVRSVDRVVEHPRVGMRRLKGRELKQSPTGYGYLAVILSRAGERRIRHVHTLVLEVFVGPCPEGMEGCHGKAGRDVNTVENLRWDTRSGNMRLAYGSSPGTPARVTPT